MTVSPDIPHADSQPAAPNQCGSVGYMIARTERLILRRADKLFQPHGLTPSQAVTLLMIERRTPVSQKELLRSLAVAQPALVAILTKLEALNLIECNVFASDRRAKAITLTAKGEALKRKADKTLTTLNAAIFNGFTTTELAQLQALLRKTHNNLDVP